MAENPDVYPYWGVIVRGESDPSSRSIAGLMHMLSETMRAYPVRGLAFTLVIRAWTAPDVMRLPWFMPLVTSVIRAVTRLLSTVKTTHNFHVSRCDRESS